MNPFALYFEKCNKYLSKNLTLIDDPDEDDMFLFIYTTMLITETSRPQEQYIICNIKQNKYLSFVNLNLIYSPYIKDASNFIVDNFRLKSVINGKNYWLSCRISEDESNTEFMEKKNARNKILMKGLRC